MVEEKDDEEWQRGCPRGQGEGDGEDGVEGVEDQGFHVTTVGASAGVRRGLLPSAVVLHEHGCVCVLATFEVDNCHCKCVRLLGPQRHDLGDY